MKRLITFIGVAVSVLTGTAAYADTIDVGPGIKQVSARPGDTLHFHGTREVGSNPNPNSEHFGLFLKGTGASLYDCEEDSLAEMSDPTGSKYVTDTVGNVIFSYDFTHTLSLATGHFVYVVSFMNKAVGPNGDYFLPVTVDVTGKAPDALLKQLKNTNATPCNAVVAQIKAGDSLGNIEDLLGKPDTAIVKNDTYTKQITYSCQDGKVDVFFNLREIETHCSVEK